MVFQANTTCYREHFAIFKARLKTASRVRSGGASTVGMRRSTPITRMNIVWYTFDFPTSTKTGRKAAMTKAEQVVVGCTVVYLISCRRLVTYSGCHPQEQLLFNAFGLFYLLDFS